MLQLCPNQPSKQPSKGITFYVVGNKFASFADNNTILTLSQAHEHADLLARISGYIIIGQGLSPKEANELQLKVYSHLKGRQIRFINLCTHKVARELVHKRDAKNVLITRPEHSGELQFSAHLVIDENCSEMSDLPDGEHVQGALLVEAARQLFMASTLIYDITPELNLRGDRLQFTLTEMNIRYQHFVFPVDAKLKLTMHTIDVKGSTGRSSAHVEVYQFDKKCCELSFEASIYSATFLNSLEKRHACKAREQLYLAPSYSQAV